MLRIAHISDIQPAKRISKKESLHSLAIETLACYRVSNKVKSLQLFASEFAEVEKLEQQVADLKKIHHIK